MEEIERRAGVARFDQFGYRNTLNSLAGGDITKYEYILNLSYNEIFVKLLMNKTEAEYQKKYAKIMKEENK